MMLSAAPSSSVPSGAPTFSRRAARTASRSTSMSKFLAESRPAMRFASVVVGSVPPLP